jgi:hypothetical protein
MAIEPTFSVGDRVAFELQANGGGEPRHSHGMDRQGSGEWAIGRISDVHSSLVRTKWTEAPTKFLVGWAWPLQGYSTHSPDQWDRPGYLCKVCCSTCAWWDPYSACGRDRACVGEYSGWTPPYGTLVSSSDTLEVAALPLPSNPKPDLCAPVHAEEYTTKTWIRRRLPSNQRQRAYDAATQAAKDELKSQVFLRCSDWPFCHVCGKPRVLDFDVLCDAETPTQTVYRVSAKFVCEPPVV